MTTRPARRITAQSGPARLDQYLAGLDLGLTRSRLQQLIADGDVLVNGAAVKPSHRIRPGDRIQLSPPPPQPAAALPQDIPLTVIYQDAHLIVIDKPPGLPAHPGPGHPDGTLVNGLLALCPDLQGIGGRIRPGIVHRLDKDTSGLIIAAKTETAHHHLSQQIKDRAIKKGYLALVQGAPSPPAGIIDVPIARDPRRRTRMAVTPNGRPSRTEYRTLQHITPHPSKRPTPHLPDRTTPHPLHRPPPPTPQRTNAAQTLLELQLHTGRTHQARVHLAWLGHPIIGDTLYGKPAPNLTRQFLHAHHLAFTHPHTHQPLQFNSPLPPDLQSALQ